MYHFHQIHKVGQLPCQCILYAEREKVTRFVTPDLFISNEPIYVVTLVPYVTVEAGPRR
jgi:hypothetical protein